MECVDFVVLIPYPAAVEAIECVGPHFYCKGKEYERADTDVTGNFYDDIQTVESLGGKVCYVGSVVFSSSKLLNLHFDTHNPKIKSFCRQVAKEIPFQQCRTIVEDFKKLRVLIIGDIIFDRYSTMSVQGLTSKNRIISGRFVGEDLQAGGALAVLRHIREFAPKVKLISLVGTEPWVESSLRNFIKPEEDNILRVNDFTTIVKQRFVESQQEGKELSKLFAVNYIDALHPKAPLLKRVLERIRKTIKTYDLIVVMDFGHGLMGDAIREMVQAKAPFLALNCQTNSNNHGFNIINRQYQRADSFSLDQTEIRLAFGKREINGLPELADLRKQLKAQYGWLTRGDIETIGIKHDGTTCACPPLEVNIVDTVGAGDAFSAVASLAAVSGLPIELATFMGQLAGAHAVRIVGNSEAIKKSVFLKGCEALLNY
ncbi:MAG: PfkB family carbohydrate kinase [Kiritimatiellae bacterium]|nr:PfkB family carbohydrate kinase [Kiritimatiellia bacterium]